MSRKKSSGRKQPSKKAKAARAKPKPVRHCPPSARRCLRQTMGTEDRHRAINEEKWKRYKKASSPADKTKLRKEAFYFDLEDKPATVYNDNLDPRAYTNSTKVRINFGSVRWIGGELYAYGFNFKARDGLKMNAAGQPEPDGVLSNYSGLMKVDSFTKESRDLLRKMGRCVKSTRTPPPARKRRGLMTSCKKKITDKKPDKKYLALKVVPYRPPKSGSAEEKKRWREDFRKNMQVGDYYATDDGHVNITKGLPGCGGGSAIATVKVGSKFCLTGKTESIPLYEKLESPLRSKKTRKTMTFVEGNWYDSDGNQITGWVAKGVLR